ncbi:MAG: hypothetical protein JWP63_4087, partial [Candidatus Solibacter sp.]|nr:hypothetical protein [Candidatus Solibacter sp.]
HGTEQTEARLFEVLAHQTNERTFLSSKISSMRAHTLIELGFKGIARVGTLRRNSSVEAIALPH